MSSSLLQILEQEGRVEFRCPGCGGSHFGSTRSDDSDFGTIVCHGSKHFGSCGWRGLRSENIWVLTYTIESPCTEDGDIIDLTTPNTTNSQ